MNAAMRVVICGGGAIGAAAAWFLARAGITPVVIERAAVACGASGKSGGFLALDWSDGSPLGPLARRSFALHAELAATLPGRWGYRRVTTLHLHHDARRAAGDAAAPGLPAWLAPKTLPVQRLGTPETTAQLDPAAFTRGLVDAVTEAGGSRVQAAVIGLARRPDGSIKGVLTDGGVVEGDAVVVAIGPWSDRVAGLDLPPVHALEGKSLIFRLQDEPTEPMAFFVDHHGADGSRDSPEVVARADGTVDVSGLSAQPPLPADPAKVAPLPATADRLLAMVQAFAPGLAAAPVVARQACFRPVMRDGLPLIGLVPGAPGAFVATGHSVWGMLNAPATGELLAQMITGRPPTVDPAPFAVDRPGLR
jgi:glycine/D-amino acid oxidase-like deaminating enzyme